MSTTQAYENLLSKNKIEMHRLKREFKERDNKHKIELNILKNTLKEITQAFKVCQIKLHKSRGESHDLYEKQGLLKIKLDDAEHRILRLLDNIIFISFYISNLYKYKRFLN